MLNISLFKFCYHRVFGYGRGSERRRSASSDGEQQHELLRLAEVEGIIKREAAQLSMDDPLLAEDLAQQAREAAIKRLREYPDCPYSHPSLYNQILIFAPFAQPSPQQLQKPPPL
jgi:hypothetical protein